MIPLRKVSSGEKKQLRKPRLSLHRLLLVFGTVTGWIMPVLWVLFIGTQVTVVQRVVDVYRQCEGEEGADKVS
jgi:hypothetical protein